MSRTENAAIQPDQTPENQTPSFLRMYTVSGHEALSQKDYKRYLKSKKKWDKEINAIKELIVKLKNIDSRQEAQRTELIREGLNRPNAEVQKIAAWMILYAPEGQYTELIREGLNHPNAEVQKIAAGMIYLLPIKEQQSSLKQAYEKIGNRLFESPLYDNIEDENFFRKPFKKTGSETVLLGKTLTEKVIIRKIGIEAFLAWQKIYEDHSLWQRSGFDYVPIEPILGYRLDAKGLVNVFSGILDMNMDALKRMTTVFSQNLEEQRSRILRVLKSVNIQHGHLHDGNFVVRFFRDEQGHIDLSKPPRLYLIDFDRAQS